MKLQENQTGTSKVYKLTIPASHVINRGWRKGTELNVIDAKILKSDIDQIEETFKIFHDQTDYLKTLRIDYEVKNLRDWLDNSLIVSEKGQYMPDEITGKKRPRPEKPENNGGHPQDIILLKKFLPLFISLAKEEITKLPSDFKLDAENEARITELMAGGN